MVISEASKLARSTPRSVFRRLSMPRQNPPDRPARLSLISRHLAPVYPINTPYAVERLPDTVDTSLLPKTQSRNHSTSANMSSQPPHPTLLIPGPIEFDDAVLQSMSHFR
jgi:alanine-glyoxylate transaminase/serine-glyoxylate transaminase/serine-pyruvate transaminase